MFQKPGIVPGFLFWNAALPDLAGEATNQLNRVSRCAAFPKW